MSGNQVGRRTEEKAKIICPPPSGVDIITDMKDFMFDETKKRKNTDMIDLTWSHHSGILIINNYQLSMNISHFKISQHLNI